MSQLTVRASSDSSLLSNSLRSSRKTFRSFKYLFAEQIRQMRKLWPFVLAYALIFPFSLIFGFSRIGNGLTDRLSLVYIITGAAVSSMVMEGVATMAGRISYMRMDGRLTYYASLPISKTAFVAALLLSRLVLVILPGLLTPLIVGVVFYGFDPLNSFGWAIVLLPACGLALSTFGMALGLSLKSADAVTMAANILVFVIILLSPVFIQFSSLPLLLQLISYLLPTTYAADALRHALVGNIDSSFFFNVGMLVLMIVLSLWWINQRLSFRLD